MVFYYLELDAGQCGQRFQLCQPERLMNLREANKILHSCGQTNKVPQAVLCGH